MSRRTKKSSSGIPVVAVVVLLVIAGVLWYIATQNKDTAGNHPGYDISSIPAYSNEAYVAINGNKPDFTEDDIKSTSYEYYSDLDSLGRCGVCIASVGKDLMPTEERGSIGSVKPTGWQTVKYDSVDGRYLYNRCHLIGYQLTAENANNRNLITGTRYLNIAGMLPFENMVADYVKETGNHVIYRATPYFEGNNLVASGVQLEGYSVEDEGEGILFNVYCYNVQPGINIDYATGNSCLAAENYSASGKQSGQMVWVPASGGSKYHTKKDCSGMENAVQITEEEALRRGYEACKRCHN